MSEGSRLTEPEISAMETPLWEQAKQAMRDGDAGRATALVDAAVRQWRSLQDYSITWITQLLSFVGKELGEEAVERALRELGEHFIRPRRDQGRPWDSLPASFRAKAIARAMVSNFGSVSVDEDDEKITLAFRCGSGGRMIDEGRYEGEDGYLTLRESGPRTFQRDELPVYCAHCSVNNEIQAVEWGGAPTTVEFPPMAKGEACVHRIYKDQSAVPDAVYERIGKRAPRRST